MQITLHRPEDLEQLHQYRRQQPNAKQRDRYRAVLLALEGHEAPTIARMLGRSRRFVQRWVYHYRDHGLEETAALTTVLLGDLNTHQAHGEELLNEFFAEHASLIHRAHVRPNPLTGVSLPGAVCPSVGNGGAVQ